jgi:hypothetical protein
MKIKHWISQIVTKKTGKIRVKGETPTNTCLQTATEHRET